jgi:hypothetical protein
MATVKRCFISLVLAFMLGIVGLVLVPALGRIAQPLLCAGTLEPETRGHGMQYRCVAAADGRITSVSTDHVIQYAIPLLALILLLPVNAVLAERERRAQRARGAMNEDLASAITARAEILRIVRHRGFMRPNLFHAAELTLILWVQPPNARPYEAYVSWLVDDESLSRLTVGSILQVRINPRRPEHVYPDQPWAHYAWWQ